MKGSVEPALLLLEAGADPRQSDYWSQACAKTRKFLAARGITHGCSPEAVANCHPDLQDAFSHALTRKSVTGSQRLQGRSVILHGLSKTELNGRRGVCGRPVPCPLSTAVHVQCLTRAMPMEHEYLHACNRSYTSKMYVILCDLKTCCVM